MQVQDDGEGHDKDDGAAVGVERYRRPGTRGQGPAERGHDINVAYSKGEGAGVLNEVMTSLWSTPRATARCELNKAMTSSWI